MLIINNKLVIALLSLTQLANILLTLYFYQEAHSELYQTYKMEVFAKMIKSLQLWTIIVKSSVLDVWQGSEYASNSSCIIIVFIAYKALEIQSTFEELVKCLPYCIRNLAIITINYFWNQNNVSLKLMETLISWKIPLNLSVHNALKWSVTL